MNHRFLAATLGLACLLLGVAAAQTPQAALRVNPVFGSHMVLQRDQPIILWGRASAGQPVTVTIGDAAVTADAEADGRWHVRLPPMSAGGPHTITVASEGQTVDLEDVLIGDVWLAVGQSNMALDFGRAADRVPDNGQLRIFTPFTRDPIPVEQAALPGAWAAAKPGTVEAQSFTVVGTLFGDAVQRAADVPVGILNASRGATHIEQWLPLDVYAEVGDRGAERATWVRDHQDDAAAAYATQYPAVQGFYERAYAMANKPRRSEEPDAPALPELPGRYRGWPAGCHNAFIAPLRGLRIRGVVWYQGESNAGIFGWGQPGDYAAKFVALVGVWRATFDNGDLPVIAVQLPANGKQEDADPRPGGWPTVRNEQLLAWHTLRQTELVSAIDLGGSLHPGLDLKAPLADRAARIALARWYDKPLAPYTGPSPRHIARNGSTVIITFDHGGDGLVDDNGGKLEGFAVIADRRASAASARIVGASVELTVPDGMEPTQVAYGLGKYPPSDLHNSTGLPAYTFILPIGFQREP